MRYKILFVILHFLTLNDTIEAVESIRKICTGKIYKIVIVDNGSQNNTGTELKKKFGSDEDVDLVLSETNLGFANGNNLGIQHCLKKYEFDFIVVCNNDTICLQNNMVDLIESEYEQYSFDVLGPLVISKNGSVNSSPVMKLPITADYVKKNYKKERIIYSVEKAHLSMILWLIVKIKTFITPNKRTIFLPVHQKNVVLHGCFLIFSKKFFDNYEGFDRRTFLYHEEELLGIMIQKRNLLSIYSPYIIIYHKEDSASKSYIGNNHKRNIFKLENCLESSKILMKALSED